MVLQAIRYSPSEGRLSILNQLLLPHATVYDEIKSVEEAWHAIKEMRVRGAPAIAIVAALSVAVELHSMLHSSTGSGQDKRTLPSAEQVHEHIYQRLDYLLTSRPTAVNLADAVKKLKRVDDDARLRADESQGARAIIEAYINAAQKMLEDDVRDNENIGRFGAEWILKKHKEKQQQHERQRGEDGMDNKIHVEDLLPSVSVLTHCNTGYVFSVNHQWQENGFLPRSLFAFTYFSNLLYLFFRRVKGSPEELP